MNERTKLVLPLALVAVLVIGTVGLLWATGGTYEPLHAERHREYPVQPAAPAQEVVPPAALEQSYTPAPAAAAPRPVSPAPVSPAPVSPAPVSLGSEVPSAPPWSHPDDGLPARRDEFEVAWANVHLASRARELGAIGPAVQAGLEAARSEMSACFDLAAASGQPADAEVAQSDPAMLLLYLEATDGAIDVVDARTEHLGAAPPELVDCCRRTLLGHRLEVPTATAGERYRYKFVVH